MTIAVNPGDAGAPLPSSGAIEWTFEATPQTNLQSFRTTVPSEHPWLNMPGFFNHKCRPAPMVVAEYGKTGRLFEPSDFPTAGDFAATVAVTRPVRLPAERQIVERARRYLAAIPPAVAGQHGDAHTFRVCCRLVRGFALDDDEALAVLSEWNLRCEPPWTDPEMQAKLRNPACVQERTDIPRDRDYGSP